MNRENITIFLVLILFSASTFIITKYSNWQMALGIYLYVIANNLEREYKLLRKAKEDKK